MIDRVLKFIGWFDHAEQTEPSHDPSHVGPCLVCEQPLAHPMKTVSIRAQEDPKRSYFFRVHRVCYVGREVAAADQKALDMIASANLEAAPAHA